MPKSKSPEKKTKSKSKPKSKSPAYGTPEQDIGDLPFDYLFKRGKKVPDTPERPKTKMDKRREEIDKRIRENPHMFPGLMKKESEMGGIPIPLPTKELSNKYTVKYPEWANKGGKKSKKNKTKKRN